MENAPVHGPAEPLTVMFADISDSSLLYATRGNTVAFGITTRCVSLMIQEVQRAGGRVVKRIGDEIMAAFTTGQAALHAAAGIQRALDADDSGLRAQGVRVRVGISAGRAVVTEGDVFGDVVNVAARLVSHASAGEVLLSGAVYEALPHDMQRAVRLLDQIVLRGRPSLVSIYRYLWRAEDLTAIGSLRLSTPGVLVVSYGERSFVLDADHPKLRIGRAPDNDIPIETSVVSRYHAEITLRGDKFFLRDSSRNGTYVQPDGTDLMRVMREEIVLTTGGDIRPGSEDTPPIHYAVRRGSSS